MSVSLGLPPHEFAIRPFDIHLLPGDQSLYGVQYYMKDVAPSRLLKVAQGFFANAVGDLLLKQSGEISGNGDLFLVHFNGSSFDSMLITDDETRVLEHAVFAPISLPTNP